MTGNIRVLLVDDHPVVRAGLRAMLADFEGIDVVAEAADGGPRWRNWRGSRPWANPWTWCSWTCRWAPGMDGVTATGRIKAGEAGIPAPPVLILTTYDTDADILAAVEAGASGYMLKDAPPEQIRQAVLSAAAGQTALGARGGRPADGPDPQPGARAVRRGRCSSWNCWPPG